MAASLNRGTRKLAIKTMSANIHEPETQKYMMPLMMVSCFSSNREVVVMTGNRFAGTYIMQAAISKAQVRLTLSGLRAFSLAPQRPQRSCALTSFHNVAQ